MKATPSYLEIRIATKDCDLRAAQRLRYHVFVEELNGNGPMVDHENRLEIDEFDPVVDHLCLIDRRRSVDDLDHVVGVYRLLPDTRADKFGRYYCDSEYDLSPLRNSDRSLLELGRSCVHPDYRRGSGMFLLWNALADYVLDMKSEILFGVASFHGTEIASLAPSLSWLHHHHLAPKEICPIARETGRQAMDLIPEANLDRRKSLIAMPALIKAYLRMGGVVGEGAFIDREFNTTDVFMLMDTNAMSQKHRRFYESRWLGQ